MFVLIIYRRFTCSVLDPSTLMDTNTYKENLNFDMHFVILGFINIRRFNPTYELLNVKKSGEKKII